MDPQSIRRHAFRYRYETDHELRLLVGRTITLPEAFEALATMDGSAHPGMTVIELP
jgi:hypothetical protein